MSYDFWRAAKLESEANSQAINERKRQAAEQMAKKFMADYPGLTAEPVGQGTITFDFVGHQMFATQGDDSWLVSYKGSQSLVILERGRAGLYEDCERLIAKLLLKKVE